MSIMDALASEDLRRAVAEAREYVRRQGGTGGIEVDFEMKDDRYQGFRVRVNCKPFYGRHSHQLAPPSTQGDTIEITPTSNRS
jgi:hypothetical protein